VQEGAPAACRAAAKLPTLKGGGRAIRSKLRFPLLSLAPRSGNRSNSQMTKKNNECNVIEDLVWLPTAWEVFGTPSYSALSETAANQARLEYYATSAKRVKYDKSGSTRFWREASPYSGTVYLFCYTDVNGNADNVPADSAGGVAPAFCVK
jgi:hypothetical protein